MVRTLGCGSGYYFVKKNCTFRFKVEPRAKSLIRYSYEILYCCRRGLERPMNDNYVTCDTGDITTITMTSILEYTLLQSRDCHHETDV